MNAAVQQTFDESFQPGNVECLPIKQGRQERRNNAVNQTIAHHSCKVRFGCYRSPSASVSRMYAALVCGVKRNFATSACHFATSRQWERTSGPVEVRSAISTGRLQRHFFRHPRLRGNDGRCNPPGNSGEEEFPYGSPSKSGAPFPTEDGRMRRVASLGNVVFVVMARRD